MTKHRGLAHNEAENIAAWLRGENIRLVHNSSAPCLLRLKGFRNWPEEKYPTEVQTSWGARFPVEDGKRAFRFIEIVRKRGECWHSNGEQAPTLGHYRIDRIAADGTVRAGCYTVQWSAIERVARELDLIQ